MANLINRAAVRRAALEVAPTVRAHPVTRVSKDFLDAIETATRQAIVNRVSSHPSVGKTLN